MPIGCFHQNRLHEQIGINHGTVCEKQNLYSDEHCHHGNLSKYLNLSPSIHKFDNIFIYSGLSAALGHEPFGREPLGHELEAEWLRVERLEAEWSEQLQRLL